MAPFRLTICGLDELVCHGDAGVTHVLSILDPDWPGPAFAEYDPHRRLELRFHDVIEADPRWLAPQQDDVERLLAFGRDLPDEGGHLLVHCHAGVSRSTAAALLILAQSLPESPADAAMRAVAALRPRAWPNLRIVEFGDALLGRGGELIAAAGAHYRRRLDGEPALAAAIIGGGRAREIGLTGA